MRKYINVYSLPRSGTNLFAAFLMKHPLIISYNVGGGRYPFRANLRLPKNEIFGEVGIEKNFGSTIYHLRDELKFDFIGKKRTWVGQYLFKHYSRFFSKYTKTVVLIRNPFSIASSMYSYQTGNESHSRLWDVSRAEARRNFVYQYASLVLNAKKVVASGGTIIDPYIFFTDDAEKFRLFEYLGLDINDIDIIKACRKGHLFEIEDNFFACPCGKLMGSGGFNPASDIDPNRLLTNKKCIDYEFLNAIECEIEYLLGSPLTRCFSKNGYTDFPRLLQELNR